jgi:hypothetical protein
MVRHVLVRRHFPTRTRQIGRAVKVPDIRLETLHLEAIDHDVRGWIIGHTMMWLTPGQSQARALPRPTRCGASYTFGQTAMLSTAVEGKGKKARWRSSRAEGAYQTVADNGAFDACCAFASSVQLLRHARICLPESWSPCNPSFFCTTRWLTAISLCR